MHHHLSVKTIKTAVLLAVATICTYQADASARAFFVSPTGDGSDGMTWKKAWKDPAQINWASVNPGDQIVLDGGTSGITYETSFTIPKSGTASAPIVVRQSPQAGHNGKITLYGGSDKPPAGYNTGIPTGVNIAGSYVHFVGARRAGIKMYSYRPPASIWLLAHKTALYATSKSKTASVSRLMEPLYAVAWSLLVTTIK
ncbi:MAG: hypothetical protein IPJ49_24975 [Candidatus Obscuribacter sp.]|nr:hypothetical protein [Candidatus Obscuribacter sp.]